MRVRPQSARERPPGQLQGSVISVRALRPTSARTAARTSNAVPQSGVLGLNVGPPRAQLLEARTKPLPEAEANATPDYAAFAPFLARPMRMVLQTAALVPSRRIVRGPDEVLLVRAMDTPFATDAKLNEAGVAAHAAVTTHENNVGLPVYGPYASRNQRAQYQAALLEQAQACSSDAVRAERVAGAVPSTRDDIQQMLAANDRLEELVGYADALDDEDDPELAATMVHAFRTASRTGEDVMRHRAHIAAMARTLGTWGRRGFDGSASYTLASRLADYGVQRKAERKQEALGAASAQIVQALVAAGLAEPEAPIAPADLDDINLRKENIAYRLRRRPKAEVSPPTLAHRAARGDGREGGTAAMGAAMAPMAAVGNLPAAPAPVPVARAAAPIEVRSSPGVLADAPALASARVGVGSAPAQSTMRPASAHARRGGMRPEEEAHAAHVARRAEVPDAYLEDPPSPLRPPSPKHKPTPDGAGHVPRPPTAPARVSGGRRATQVAAAVGREPPPRAGLDIAANHKRRGERERPSVAADPVPEITPEITPEAWSAAATVPAVADDAWVPPQLTAQTARAAQDATAPRPLSAAPPIRVPSTACPSASSPPLDAPPATAATAVRGAARPASGQGAGKAATGKAATGKAATGKAATGKAAMAQQRAAIAQDAVDQYGTLSSDHQQRLLSDPLQAGGSACGRASTSAAQPQPPATTAAAVRAPVSPPLAQYRPPLSLSPTTIEVSPWGMTTSQPTIANLDVSAGYSLGFAGCEPPKSPAGTRASVAVGGAPGATSNGSRAGMLSGRGCSDCRTK